MVDDKFVRMVRRKADVTSTSVTSRYSSCTQSMIVNLHGTGTEIEKGR